MTSLSRTAECIRRIGLQGQFPLKLFHDLVNYGVDIVAFGIDMYIATG